MLTGTHGSQSRESNQSERPTLQVRRRARTVEGRVENRTQISECWIISSGHLAVRYNFSEGLAGKARRNSPEPDNSRLVQGARKI